MLAVPMMMLSPMLAMAGSESSETAMPGQQRCEYAEGKRLCFLSNREINESSGLANGKRNVNVIWTHNDSGDSPRIFAFNLEGEDLGTFIVDGAQAIDWEDMASARIGLKDCLVIADVGDNRLERETYRILILEEPLVQSRQEAVAGTVDVLMTVEFTYEDGSHDCEAVAVDPHTATIYLVSKTHGAGTKVYELEISQGNASGAPVARKIATPSIPETTAMDISPDGLKAVLMTYTQAYEYARHPDESWTKAFNGEPRVIPMPRRLLGESVCYGPDGQTLYLTSEMIPTPLWEVPPK
jgi:hypothetical protein